MPVDGPLPEEWETHQLLQLGLSLHDADEIAHDRAQELLAIHRIVKKAEGGGG